MLYMTDLRESGIQSAPALRALLTDIIDYAGIFPPASLPLGEAVENFARYRRSSFSWMLGNFVVPGGCLPELTGHIDGLPPVPPFRLSVVLAKGNDSATFLDALESELQHVSVFAERHGDRVALEAFEMNLPRELLGTDVVTVGRFVARVTDLLERARLRRSDFFVEIPLDANCRQTATIAAGAVHAENRRKSDDQGAGGLKMRTGGTQPSAIPEAAHIAEFIVACRDAGVPFKATAGLHHPVRHFDAEMGAATYGFLNVFVAAALAAVDHADESDLLPVLLEENVDAFSFSGDELRWRDRRLGIDDIERTRRDRAVSFGSCSFAEPVDDLAALGLI